jgi:hypothetical protein
MAEAAVRFKTLEKAGLDLWREQRVSCNIPIADE